MSGGDNLLNRPNHYPYSSAKQWWLAYNGSWLKNAVDKGDEIFLATKDFSKLTNNGNLTTYAYEVRYLIERKYKPINVTTKEWEQLQTLVEQLNFD